jgi:hypothetical protein
MSGADIINYIVTLDYPTIIGMFVIGWYFTREIRDDVKAIKLEMKQLEKDMRDGLDTQSKRTDKLYESFIELIKEGKNKG